MRPLLYLFFLVASFSVMLCAQGNGARLGLRVGGNISTWKGNYLQKNDPIKQKFLFGFQLGAAFHLPLPRRFAIETNLQVALQGTEEKETIGINTSHRQYQLVYLDMPIVVKYYPFQREDGLNFQLGPKIGYVISKSGKEIVRQNVISTKILSSRVYDAASFRVQDNQGGTHSLLNDVNFGLVSGIGYDILHKVMIDLRYSLGFSRVINAAAGDENTHQSNHRNHAISFTLSYFFSLKSKEKEKNYPDWYAQ